ncbi:hypothetical protein K439DRAFT_1159251 [Ramaria rubella]|nr:hypothetical protein K439DRAFT_1159251 [Ramaria rubella]
MRLLAIVSVFFAVTQVVFATGADSAPAVASRGRLARPDETALIQPLLNLHQPLPLSPLHSEQPATLPYVSHFTLQTSASKMHHITTLQDLTVRKFYHKVKPNKPVDGMLSTYHKIQEVSNSPYRTTRRIHHVTINAAGMKHEVETDTGSTGVRPGSNPQVVGAS